MHSSFIWPLTISFQHCSILTHVSSGGWKIGPLVATVPQRHSHTVKVTTTTTVNDKSNTQYSYPHKYLSLCGTSRFYTQCYQCSTLSGNSVLISLHRCYYDTNEKKAKLQRHGKLLWQYSHAEFHNNQSVTVYNTNATADQEAGQHIQIADNIQKKETLVPKHP